MAERAGADCPEIERWERLGELERLHAARLATKLGITRVIVPLGAVVDEEGKSFVHVKTAQGWRMVAHHASPGTAQEAPEIVEAPAVLH